MFACSAQSADLPPDSNPESCKQEVPESVEFSSRVEKLYQKKLVEAKAVFKHILVDPVKYSSQIYWLKQLGFDFTQLEVIAPTFSDLVTTYEKLIHQQVNDWNDKNPEKYIPQNTILVPQLVVRHRESKEWRFFHPGKVPDLSEYNINVFTVYGSGLYPAILQGVFPVGLGHEVSKSFLYHDLVGHLTGFLEHPYYMSQYVDLVRQITTSYSWPSLIEDYEPLYSRMYYFNESLVLASHQAILQRASLYPYDFDLKKIKSFDGTSSELQKKLYEEHSLEELKSLAENFHAEASRIFVYFGGAARDPVNATTVSDYHDITFNLLADLKGAINLTEFSLPPHVIKKNLSWRLAKLHWLSLTLAQVDVKDWKEMILADEASDYMKKLFGSEDQDTIFTDDDVESLLIEYHSTH